MKNPTVNYSVIIPHYNSPKLLARCLASIPEREDIQVIVVDDCSKPDIVEFSHLPGHGRPNTEVYQTPYGGSAGRARNVGLDHAKGKWLLFADADDFYTPQAWNLFDKYLDSEADIIYFGLTSADSDTLMPTERHKAFDQFVQAYAAEPTQENEKWLRYRHDVPWGKLIRRGLVVEQGIRFGETRYYNDTLFSCNCAISARAIAAESKEAYCVTDSNCSLTKQMSPDALIIRLTVTCTKNQILRRHNLREYQMPILFYLRMGWKLSPRLFFKLVLIGIQFNSSWCMEIKRWVLRQHTKSTR